MANLFVAFDQITPDTPVPASQGAFISCTVAGNVTLKLAAGGTITFAVAVGATWLNDWSIIDAPSAGKTATCVVYALRSPAIR